jgi:hypothetical protein
MEGLNFLARPGWPVFIGPDAVAFAIGFSVAGAVRRRVHVEGGPA